MIRLHQYYEKQVTNAIELSSSHHFTDELLESRRNVLHQTLTTLFAKMKQLSAVAYRHEILAEEVATADKIFSLFEDHTDCIIKGSREVIFGHKINLTGGKSNILLMVFNNRAIPQLVITFVKHWIILLSIMKSRLLL